MDTQLSDTLTGLWTLFARLDQEKDSDGGLAHELRLWPDGAGRVNNSRAPHDLAWNSLEDGIARLSAYLNSPAHRGWVDHEPSAPAAGLVAAWPVFQAYIQTLPATDPHGGACQADPPTLLFANDGAGYLVDGPLTQWGKKRSAADALRALLPKPAMLKPKEETTYVLTDREVNELMWTHLGLEDYEVIADQEWDNSESHLIEIALKEYDQREREMVAEVLGGKQDTMFKLRSLMAELADRGHIPWGTYRIDIHW